MSDNNVPFSDHGERSIPAQLGYLTKAVEDLCDSHNRLCVQAQSRDNELSQRMAKIENHISVYKGAILVAKWIGAVIVAVVTFKVGDIAGIWTKLQH